jgi:hypothetical protein
VDVFSRHNLAVNLATIALFLVTTPSFNLAIFSPFFSPKSSLSSAQRETEPRTKPWKLRRGLEVKVAERWKPKVFQEF